MRRTQAAWLVIAVFVVPMQSAQPAEPGLDREIPLRRRLSKSTTRWQRFDAEFGLQGQRTTPVTTPIARAKYGVDLALFSLDTAMDAIEDAVELRYSQGRIQRAATALPVLTPVTRPTGPLTLEDARLKFDLELASGRPYLGVRLVIPLGN